MIRPGTQLRLSADQTLLTVWSASDQSGCYWCHKHGGPEEARGEHLPIVLVRVRHPRNAVEPIVTIVEESAL